MFPDLTDERGDGGGMKVIKNIIEKNDVKDSFLCEEDEGRILKDNV